MVSEYINQLLESQRIMTHEWLDANIHAMIVFILAPFCNLLVVHDGTFGYRHNKHVSELNSTSHQWTETLSFYPMDDEED